MTGVFPMDDSWSGPRRARGNGRNHREIPGEGREEAVGGFDEAVSSTVAGRGAVFTGESPGTAGRGG